MTDKKILVIGASGFFGSYIAEKLYDLYDNKDITILGRKHKIWHSKTIKQKIRNLNLLKYDFSKFKKFDCVIHCAGLHSEKNKTWNDFYNTNSLITKKILENISFKKLIYISTLSVLSNNKNYKDFPDPSNNYGLSKYISEKLIELHSRNSKSQFIILRYPTIIGNNSKLNLIDYIYNQCERGKDIEIFSNADLKRNYIHVSKAFHPIKKLIDKKNFKSNFELFNIASSNSMSLKDIVNLIKSYTFSNSRINIVKKKQNYNFNVKIDISKSLKYNILKPITTKINIIDFLNDKKN